jgi:hypothetical protein
MSVTRETDSWKNIHDREIQQKTVYRGISTRNRMKMLRSQFEQVWYWTGMSEMRGKSIDKNCHCKKLPLRMEYGLSSMPYSRKMPYCQFE